MFTQLVCTSARRSSRTGITQTIEAPQVAGLERQSELVAKLQRRIGYRDPRVWGKIGGCLEGPSRVCGPETEGAIGIVARLEARSIGVERGDGESQRCTSAVQNSQAGV